ncbi:long-chain-fatty-acid--CoA ligase [Nocardia sp. 004]|uniref:long-chain-fatty-acid--CoA ligase n=1 Tax=Nocardia sp. 004 TaxID=3385978 RepID=UPI0039A39AD6
MNNLPTLIPTLQRHAATRPAHPALLEANTTTTYADLAARAAAVAQALCDAGIRADDRIAYLAKDTAAVFELLYGCATIGAVLVPINWRLAPGEITDILQHSRARLVVTDDPARIGSSCDLVVPVTDFESWRTPTEPAAVVAVTATPDTPVVQMYTSGTTGTPKGVVLAHRTFFAVRNMLDTAGLDWIDWHPTEVNLLALPTFHIGGLWWALQGLCAGVTNVVIPAFTATAAITAIRENNVTTSCFVPSMLLMLLSEPGKAAADFASLRKIVYGGSPIGPDLLTRAVDTFGCEFAQIYGLTETGNTAICLPPADHVPGQQRLHAAGTPYPGVDIEIRRVDGTRATTGESGEVFLRSPAQMVEYFADPEATAATLTDGWIRTGDAGYLDTDGYLVLRDRVKDLIIVAGENVYPAEVEKAITAHPAVYDCAVIGTPDDTWGERVHAFVVTHPDTELRTRDLVRFLTGRLAAFKIPSRYEFLDTIPRNPSGKILRRTLRERFWADRDRRVN